MIQKNPTFSPLINRQFIPLSHVLTILYTVIATNAVLTCWQVDRSARTRSHAFRRQTYNFVSGLGISSDFSTIRIFLGNNIVNILFIFQVLDHHPMNDSSRKCSNLKVSAVVVSWYGSKVCDWMSVGGFLFFGDISKTGEFRGGLL